MILQFIFAVVDEEHLSTFTVERIDELLRNHFHIEIPSATIRSCLIRAKEKFKYTRGEFVVIAKIEVLDSIRESFDTYSKTCEDVLSEIRSLIERQEMVILTGSQIEELRAVVYDYIIDENNGIANYKYSPYILEYFVRNENDQNFCVSMNAAKEGLLIYKGLQYSSQTTGLTWKSPTTFYLDMEYLFWAFGFNDEYDKQYFMDFYNLIQEINEGTPKHNGKPLIQIRYFNETKDEIDRYFYKASLIKQHKELPNLSSPAMCKICNECKDEIEVMKYKARFYTHLNRLGITVERKTIDITQHKDKLFETPELIDELEREFQGEDLEEAKNLIKIADYISILRNGHVQSTRLEDCKYVFLSNTNLTNKVSKILHSRDSNAKLFVFTRMGLFTDLMWYKAQKGLISNQHMPSFDIIGRAKNIMSTLIHTKICDAYENLKKEKDSKDELIAMYSSFRDFDYRPEAINSSNVDSNVDFLISEVDYCRYKERLSSLQKMATEGNAVKDAYKVLESEKSEIEAELALLKSQEHSKELQDRLKLYKIARCLYSPAYFLYGYYSVWIGLITFIAICIASYISFKKGAVLITILSACISIFISYCVHINKLRQYVRLFLKHRYRKYCNKVFDAYYEGKRWIRIWIQL